MTLVVTRVPRKVTVTDVERAGDEPAPRRSPVTAPGSPTASAGAIHAGPADQSDPGVRWQRPSPRLLRARRLEVVLLTAPVALAGGLIAGFAGSLVLGLGVGLALVVTGLLSERFLARRVAAWGYAERNDDLMVRRGGSSAASRSSPTGGCSSSTSPRARWNGAWAWPPCGCTPPPRPATRAFPGWTARQPPGCAISSLRSARRGPPGL